MSTPAKFESFFLVLALPFLAIAIWLFWRDGSEWMMSRDVSQWQTAEARVVSASVRQTRDRDLPAHSSHVTKISFEYKYEVDGEEYRGERFAFGHRKPADEIEKLERGETIPILCPLQSFGGGGRQSLSIRLLDGRSNVIRGFRVVHRRALSEKSFLAWVMVNSRRFDLPFGLMIRELADSRTNRNLFQ